MQLVWRSSTCQKILSCAKTNLLQLWQNWSLQNWSVTWAWEQFRSFILGLHLRLETDHRPLVSLLGNKSIDQLSPRLQRFCLILMWFNYDIAYVQVKNLTTADTLFRSPTTRKDVLDQLSREAERLINMIIETAPISSVKFQQCWARQDFF